MPVTNAVRSILAVIHGYSRARVSSNWERTTRVAVQTDLCMYDARPHLARPPTPLLSPVLSAAPFPTSVPLAPPGFTT
jgi:hypothetical protein